MFEVDVSTALPATTLEECKAWLRIEYSFDDSLLEGMILAGTQLAEQKCGREIVKRNDPKALADDVSTVPFVVKQWIWCYVKDLYEGRGTEAGGDAGGHNSKFDNLLAPFLVFERTET